MRPARAAAAAAALADAAGLPVLDAALAVAAAGLSVCGGCWRVGSVCDREGGAGWEGKEGLFGCCLGRACI